MQSLCCDGKNFYFEYKNTKGLLLLKNWLLLVNRNTPLLELAMRATTACRNTIGTACHATNTLPVRTRQEQLAMQATHCPWEHDRDSLPCEQHTARRNTTGTVCHASNTLPVGTLQGQLANRATPACRNTTGTACQAGNALPVGTREGQLAMRATHCL
jgi:hypothetical protein